MALVLADRVRENTTTAGTGNIALGGAVTGFQAFSDVMAIGDTTYYTIAGQGTSEWEVGIGTLTGTSVLVRTTVFDSSNNGSLVNFAAGTKDVFITYPAIEAVPKSFLDGGYETLTTTLGVNSNAKGSWVWSPDLGSFGGELYGFTISDDGLRLYSVAGTNDRINQFSLAYPYDVTSATFVGFFSIGAQTGTPNSLSINPTGTRVYVGMYSGSPNNVFQYNLSTPWDITTASYAGNLPIFASLTDNNQFSNDGLLFFIANIGGIQTYTLTTPYDITSGVTLLRGYGVGTMYGFTFSSDGLQLFTQANDGNITRRTLSVAWDTDTAGAVTQSANLADSNRFPQTYGSTRGPLHINKGVTGVPNGTRFFSTIISSGWRIAQFELDSANNLTDIARPLYDLSRATSRQVNLNAGTYNNYVARLGTPPYDFQGMTKLVRSATALRVVQNTSFIRTINNTSITTAIGDIFEITHEGSGVWNMISLDNALLQNFYGLLNGSNGLVTYIGPNSLGTRAIVPGDIGINVTNQDGGGGNPTLYNDGIWGVNSRNRTTKMYTWWHPQYWNTYGEGYGYTPWGNWGATDNGTLNISQMGGGYNGTDTPDNFYWDKARDPNITASYQGAMGFPRAANDRNNYLRRYYYYNNRWYQREMIYIAESNWNTNARSTQAMSELCLLLNWTNPVDDTLADSNSYYYAIPFEGSASQVPVGTRVFGTFLVSGTTAAPTILSQSVTTTTVVNIHVNGQRYRLTYWTADGLVSNVIEGGGYTASSVEVTFTAGTTFYYNYWAEGDITTRTFVKVFFSNTATANWTWQMGDDRGGTVWRVYDASANRAGYFGGIPTEEAEWFIYSAPFPATRTKRIWSLKPMALPVVTNGVARNFTIQCRFRVDDITTINQNVLQIFNASGGAGLAVRINEGTVDRRLSITLNFPPTPTAIITSLKPWQFNGINEWIVVTWVWNPLDTAFPGRLYVNDIMMYKTATNPFTSSTAWFNLGALSNGSANGFQGYVQYLTVVPECWGQYIPQGSCIIDVEAGDPAWTAATYNAGADVGFSSRNNYGFRSYLRGSSWRIGANIRSDNYWDGPVVPAAADTFTLACNLVAGSSTITLANTTAGFPRNPGIFMVTGAGIPTTNNIYVLNGAADAIVAYGEKTLTMFNYLGAVAATSTTPSTVTFVRCNGGANNAGYLNMPGNALFVAKTNNATVVMTNEMAGINSTTETSTCAFPTITFTVQADATIDENYYMTNSAANNTAASNLINALTIGKVYTATGTGITATSATIDNAYIVGIEWDFLGVGRHRVILNRARNAAATASTITARFVPANNSTFYDFEITGGNSAMTTDESIEMYGYSPLIWFSSSIERAKSAMATAGIGQWRYMRLAPPGCVYDSGIFKAATTTFAKRMYLGYGCIGYLITYGTTGDFNQSTVNPIVSTIAWAATNGMNSDGFSLTTVANTFYRVIILPFNSTIAGDYYTGTGS